MRALIIANGTPPSGELLRQLAGESDLLICADGGAAACEAAGLSPGLIVGDLDSLAAPLRSRFSGSQIVRAEDQNFTDLDKCLSLARERGASEVWLAGVLGGRLDHELSNLSSAEGYTEHFGVEIHEDSCLGVFMDGTRGPNSRKFSSQLGQRVSIFSFIGVQSVTTSGLRYPLNGEELQFGKRVSISNVADQESVTVSVRGGKVLVCFLK